jgi:hypothetical protein
MDEKRAFYETVALVKAVCFLLFWPVLWLTLRLRLLSTVFLYAL